MKNSRLCDIFFWISVDFLVWGEKVRVIGEPGQARTGGNESKPDPEALVGHVTIERKIMKNQKL